MGDYTNESVVLVGFEWRYRKKRCECASACRSIKKYSSSAVTLYPPLGKISRFLGNITNYEKLEICMEKELIIRRPLHGHLPAKPTLIIIKRRLARQQLKLIRCCCVFIKIKHCPWSVLECSPHFREVRESVSDNPCSGRTVIYVSYENMKKTDLRPVSKVLGIFGAERVRFSVKLKTCKTSVQAPYSPYRSVTDFHVTAICLMETLAFLWTCFLMTFRFLEVLKVRFYPLPGRQPSLPSSLKRQIASDNVCRGTFSK
ncbi:hypothetical protein TNCV_3243401 [Trichonephila clavipes]|nr:hypothetical protein TNCV_3243401 [Trichonephila clavipes]